MEDERLFFRDFGRAENARLCRFFWVYEAHLEQWRKNSQLLLIDNTYQVNCFSIPLLEITGVSALNTNFSCGFGLASREDPEFLYLASLTTKDGNRQSRNFFTKCRVNRF